MNVLDKAKQIEIISALCEGVGSAPSAASPALTVRPSPAWRCAWGAAAPINDRMMVGVRTSRLELDELWSFVAKKQARVHKNELAAAAVGDQSTSSPSPLPPAPSFPISLASGTVATRTLSFTTCASGSSARPRFQPMASCRIKTPSAPSSAIRIAHEHHY